MGSKNNRILILQFICIFIILILVYGCIYRPIQEISDAENALFDAREAEVEKYAFEEFKEAESKLIESKNKMKKRNYNKAKELALESKNIAILSKEHAKDLKEKIMEDQKKQAISSLDTANAALEKTKEATFDAKLIGIKDYEQEYTELTKLYLLAKDELERKEYQKSYKNSKSIYQRARRIELAAKRSINLSKAQDKEVIESKNVLNKKNKEAFNLINHTVRKGECLWIIAGYEQIYANPYKWPLIYKANSSKIKDPDYIYPGQKLIIPRELTQEEINAAIYEANHRGIWSLFDNN